MLRIGLDLDNTLINYDTAFLTAARERGLIPAGLTGTKQQVRDHIRALPGGEGETEWQKLQGYVYGAGIAHAQLFPGVMAFLKKARAQGAALFIVSHKTEFGHFDASRVNLREAARGFLQSQGVFAYVPAGSMFFYATRPEKVKKIAELACDAFVDDLEEVFAEPGFPPAVRRLLFTTAPPDNVQDLEICGDWPQVERRLLSEP